MKQRQVSNSVFYAQLTIMTKEKQDSMLIFLCEHLLSSSSPDEPPLHNGDYSAILCFQTDPPRSSCMQLWMSDCSFTQSILDIHQSGYSIVWLLHGWSQYTFCGHHATMHLFRTSTFFEATYVGCMGSLAVMCHPHFWWNDQDLLCATYCSNTGVEQTLK